MFESIARRSGASPTRRLSGVAVAGLVHGGALALALFLARPGPVEVKVVEPEPPVHQPRPPIVTVVGNPPPQANTDKNLRRHRPQPRELPKPVEVDPAPVTQDPSEPPAPIAEDPGPAGPVGPPGAVGGPGPTGPAVACPEGARCGPAVSEPDQVLSFTSGTMERPRPNCEPPHPQAPQAAQQFGIEGSVIALYVVYADGHVGGVRVLNADAPPLLAQSVRDWLEGCEFTAARIQDHPVNVRMTQTFRFKSR